MHRHLRNKVLTLLSFGITMVTLAGQLAVADHTIDFETQLAPLLVQRCVECHQGPRPAGGLRLTTREGLLQGGDSGRVVNLDSPAESYLLQRILEGEMPPEVKGQSRKLSSSEIALIGNWLASGMSWPKSRQLDWFEHTNNERAGRDWWSLQPIQKSAVPHVAADRQPENVIDAFVLHALDRHGMVPAPQADKRTLLRRVYYDLIGLPPGEEDFRTFLADDSPGAWERVVTQLLQRPQYGERWAKFWLDLARYADTSGYERDQEKVFAWKYRDWVVRAFNDDMPFGQFIVEQIAGDEIAHRTEQSVVATGFLRLGTWNDEPNQPEDYQYDRLEDMVHTTSSAFLGLTVKCARCHSHKFDPIKQDDYYRMASAFWAGPITARDRKLLGGPSADELGFEQVLGWTDLGPQPTPLHVLRNGDRSQPLHVVVPASLSAIRWLERPFDPPPDGAKTSRRRIQLAEWIADPRNPLTPRVIVNRVWQHHFGQAIVRTPNNFGFLADPPTHPKLLDWLAAEFLEHGSSLKYLHKLILTSRTWMQSSGHPHHEAYEKLDSANRLWWRAQRRRLDAESLRDSMLAVSGELDLTLGGESFRPTISSEALEGLSRKSSAWTASTQEKQQRRSLYMYLKRGLLPPMMTAFDLGDVTQSCGQRDVTIVPTQALVLLNNQFVHERSQHLAASILRDYPHRSAQICQAWSRVLRRLPSDREMELSRSHVEVQSKYFANTGATGKPARSALENAHLMALASLCHTLLNSNEFLFVD